MRWMYLTALLLGAGCTNLEDMNAGKADGTATENASTDNSTAQAQENAAAPAANAAPEQPAPPKAANIPAVEAKVVDLKKAQAENPSLVVIDNKIRAGDPFSAAAAAYVSIHAKAQLLAFQHSLKTARAVEGRNPTYEEFLELVKQHRVDFNRIKPYQMYGYDQETGDLVMLEDKAMKVKLFKEKGIPLEPGDEQYDADR